MTKILTPRLKLTKESDDEYIDPFPLNWPILDTYAGGLLVADGVTPADVNLYNGCLVVEQTSGKQWIAKQDPNTGTFTKKWLVFPWFAEVGTASQAVGSSFSNPVEYLFTTFFNGINSSAASLVSNRLQVPIDAVYELHYAVRGTPPNGTDAVMSAYISVNQDNNYIYSNTEEKNNNALTNNAGTRITKLKANDVLSLKLWQSYSAVMTVGLYLSASVVCPV